VSEDLTKVTEIVTALGTLAPDLSRALTVRPVELANVPDEVWEQLIEMHAAALYSVPFDTAFANGVAFLDAVDGLRGRRPRLVEWKGPHRPPGDDVIPADLRIDHVYLVSCKYLSKVLLNPGPLRLFDRLLVGEERTSANWFNETAPGEFQAFYGAVRRFSGLALPHSVTDLTVAQQREIRRALSSRTLPKELQPTWAELCQQVSNSSARRWTTAMSSKRAKLRLLWRLLRISNATYFVLGTDDAEHLRLRVASMWDWNQTYELRALTVTPRLSGQPEVGWRALVRERSSRRDREILGHVEVRWSHGRFVGSPEAKVYLDIPLAEVPGYFPLAHEALARPKFTAPDEGGEGSRP
jgi:hypothetical protein